MSTTSTLRVFKLRAEATRKGWKRREYYATSREHEKLKKYLKKLRE